MTYVYITIHSDSKSSDNKIIVHPVLNGKQVTPGNLQGNLKWIAVIWSWKLKSGETLKVKGIATIEVIFNQQTASLPVVILEGNGPTLFGWDWLKHIIHIGLGVEQVIAKH